MQLDYSIYYRRFHDDTEAHADKMADYFWSVFGADIPADRKARIVDIGCGFGFALRALKKAGYENIAGLETDRQQAERALAAGFNVELVTDSREWFSAREQSLDVVLMIDVLEHVPMAQQIPLLIAIREALRPDGKLLLQVPNANAILSMRWRYNDFTHYTSFTEHSLYFVLANAGFKQIEFDNDKGLGRFPRRLWRRTAREAARLWLVRWFWLQVFKAEQPWAPLDEICFNLNMRATAYA